jgi:FKBP-type peptidyl-prolyl cis-trans isomerase
MAIGELARFTIPSGLEYGAHGKRTVVPPNSDLNIEIELVNISPPS